MANPPPGVDVPPLDDSKFAFYEQEYAQRNAEVASRLATLIEELRKRVDLPGIQLVDATPRDMKVKNGFMGAQQITVMMAVGDVMIEYKLGGAGHFRDRWYCLEHPSGVATLVRDNKAETIRCEKPGKPSDATP